MRIPNDLVTGRSESGSLATPPPMPAPTPNRCPPRPAQPSDHRPSPASSRSPWSRSRDCSTSPPQSRVPSAIACIGPDGAAATKPALAGTTTEPDSHDQVTKYGCPTRAVGCATVVSFPGLAVPPAARMSGLPITNRQVSRDQQPPVPGAVLGCIRPRIETCAPGTRLGRDLGVRDRARSARPARRTSLQGFGPARFPS